MKHYVYEEIVTEVSQRLKALRIKTGMTQSEFARQHGWIRSHWAVIEKGRKMTLRNLVKAANSFDMSVQELLRDTVRHEGPGDGSPKQEKPSVRKWEPKARGKG